MQEEKKGTQIASRVFDDGTIVELVAQGNQTTLCVSKDGAWQLLPEYLHDNGECVRPIPYSNNLISHGAIRLPSEPAEYGSINELRNDLTSYIARYVTLSPDALITAVSYVLLTWLFDVFEEVPYIRFLGDLGSGKTRALKVIGGITNKPFLASAASTISPIFYALDQFAPTLLLDEADLRWSDASNEFVKVLNNGNGKSLSVLRQSVQSKKGDFEPRAFRVYGPKILAMRKRFTDDGLESRFLTEVMGTTSPSPHVPISLPKGQEAEALALRNKLLCFRIRNLHHAKIDTTTEVSTRSGRFNQMVMPLLSVTESGEARAAILRFAAQSDDRLQAMRHASLEAVTRRSYLELSGQGTKPVAVGDVADKVRDRIADYGRPVTNKLVGAVLRSSLGLETWKSGGKYWVARQ
ncbi:MAG: hypothetical protein JNL19_12420 [Burkholderiales bacterium]|nr:hypothetical protein [Burkholderiales bacterium]